jgi:hypothetical protein
MGIINTANNVRAIINSINTTDVNNKKELKITLPAANYRPFADLDGFEYVQSSLHPSVLHYCLPHPLAVSNHSPV